MRKKLFSTSCEKLYRRCNIFKSRSNITTKISTLPSVIRATYIANFQIIWSIALSYLFHWTNLLKVIGMLVNFGIFELVAHLMHIKEVNSFHKKAPSQMSDRIKYLPYRFCIGIRQTWPTLSITSPKKRYLGLSNLVI